MKYAKLLLLPALLLLLLSACNKDKNKKSELYIGDNSISTRNVEGYYIMGEPELYLKDKVDGKTIHFGLNFNNHKFPTSGSFILSYGGTGDSLVPIGFVLDQIQYYTDKHNQTKLDAYEYNGRGKYIINPTWFYSYYPDPTNTYYIKGNDSILVSGALYEPIDITSR